MKAVLFDLDGTLLDTLEDLTDAINFAMEKMAFPKRSLREIRAFLGTGAVNLVRQSLPENQKDTLEEALALFQGYYAQNNRVKTRPFPGLLPLLDRLKEEGFALAVISNKPDPPVKVLAKEYFPAIGYAVGEQTGVRRKPAPDSVFKAMEALGADREHCVYIGDSEVDVETAKNAAIPCIAVTWGFRDKDELEKAGAEHFAHTAQELYRKIRELT